MIPNPEFPSPSHWGWWKDTTGWQPQWTTLPEASKSCRGLIRCGCIKDCTTRCKCVKAALKCDGIKENGLIAGLAKIDFFPEMASTRLRYCPSKIRAL